MPIETVNDYRSNPGRLSKSEHVLDYSRSEWVQADAQYQNEDGSVVLFLPMRDHKGFGTPSQITVTIVPGDTLNEEK